MAGFEPTLIGDQPTPNQIRPHLTGVALTSLGLHEVSHGFRGTTYLARASY